MRHDRRTERELRKIAIQTNVFKHPEGSVLISFGDTQVICSATIEDSVPPFLRGEGKGWVTAEYSMLPRATNTRNRRESAKGKVTGRTMEIQRLIGRALRAVIDLEKLGERSIIVDCDVIQADGGTRTASITGGFVALRLAINHLLQKKELEEDPIKEHLAAISVGILPDGSCVADLDYVEDSSAFVDMNLVMTESGQFVEIQGTGEEATFDGDQLNSMLSYGKRAIEDLIAYQKEALLDAESLLVEPTENTIVIATRNPGKAKEFEALFATSGYAVKTLLDYPELPDVEETGKTFEENARLKAETIAQILQQPVLADDSGLKVDALGGMPGIYSARFAGEPTSDAANNAKLLHELTDVTDRQAQFHCTLVFAAPQKESLVVEAEWPGTIGRIPRGENGFGYDPLFIVDGLEKTSAELDSAEKNKLSHRGQALEKLKKEWQTWLEG
ncbi:ribonuclease PH [Enterococcus sp. JM4C]|uniref:ribonuclease PH n=1 Tax=Candidatus Enterococcus huntleyi TaxID=1857217 RepID=UPI00137ABF25|nr:ribonuclease PH [Enterococcus sp. JM4C]KAF1296595.1 ribonuclease PH [Enterococcus sp. JM4C]